MLSYRFGGFGILTQTVDAIYQDGSFRLIRPKEIPLREGQSVRLTIETEEKEEGVLELAAEVYQGLTDRQIDEIEKVALDRSEFFDDRK